MAWHLLQEKTNTALDRSAEQNRTEPAKEMRARAHASAPGRKRALARLGPSNAGGATHLCRPATGGFERRFKEVALKNALTIAALLLTAHQSSAVFDVA